MTNMESALNHLRQLFEGSPWLQRDDATVPGCMNLTWSELYHVYQAAQLRQVQNIRHEN